jgi:hypothetical protein
MSIRKNERGSSLDSLSRGPSPPGFRISKEPDKVCGNCDSFYLQKGWKGLGKCTKYVHLTDESLVCDSHESYDEP